MVQASQGKFILRCDTAVNYIQDNFWDIIGNVIVFDSLKTLYTSRMNVNINEEKVTFPEPFKIIDEKGREFYADKGIYYYKKKNIWAFGNVRYNDNIAEIIMAPYIEKEPKVRIFDYNGSLKKEFIAYPHGFWGGVNLASSDVDQDGYPDILTGAGYSGGAHLRFFDKEGIAKINPTLFVYENLSTLFLFHY